MVQHNRLYLRLFLLLVLGMGLFGAWYTSHQFQIDTITLPTMEESADWVDLIALVGEEILQLFLGMTSGQ
ncbi:MAG: hypothetical protein KDE19_13230 [Caldilineaceae bacterium]|nr:hypothetical protein [Caldilineaceae bacterium]